MAQRVVVQKTDDIDGSQANETVTFAVDGVTYEIDLSDAHAAALRAAVQPYAVAARRVGGGAGRRASVHAVKAARDYDPKALRAWAGSHKIALPAREGFLRPSSSSTAPPATNDHGRPPRRALRDHLDIGRVRGWSRRVCSFTPSWFDRELAR